MNSVETSFKQSFLRMAVLCLVTFGSFQLGQAVELKITGLSEKKVKEVYSNLEPRLEYILKRDASSWRGDDAAFFLKRELIRRGYPEAEVAWVILDPQLIELKVSAGYQYLFGKINSKESSPLNPKELREYFLQPLVNTERVSAKKAPYIEDYVNKGANNVQNYLKSIGYWNAQATVSSEEKVTASKRFNITLDLQEGNRLTLNQPKLNGASSENEALLRRRIRDKIGRPASTKNINAIRQKIEGFYADRGYQLATISMTVEHSLETTQLLFEINEGSQYKVNEVTVKGTEKTNEKRIRRYFRKEQGKNYDQGEIDRITKRLISSGAFTSIVVDPQPAGDGSDLINLKVSVKEAKAKTFRSYAGFGNFEGFILGAGYSDSNFNGDLRKLYLGGEFSSRGLLGEIGIGEPRLFNSPMDASARLFLIDRNFEGYDVRRAGFEAALNWAPTEHLATRFYARTQYATSSSSSLSSAELGPEEYLATSFGIEQSVDFRNNPLVPTQGYHGRILLEGGFTSGSTENNYLRTALENSYRYRIDRNHILMVRHLVSFLYSNNPSDLPIDLRLFSGGINTQRAYNERELGPQSLSGDPLGGEAFWVGSVELIRPLSSIIDAVAFADAGQLYRTQEEFTFSDPSYAAGLGLRINLPIGPIRLEYGHNLNRQSEEPSGTFHFSIGTSF